MLIRIAIENNVEGRTLAWALDYPGCFAYGVDAEAALKAMPAAFFDYAAWLAAHGGEKLLPGETTFRVAETWEVYTIGKDFELAQEGYEVNAWFRHDWKPLTAAEIEHGLRLLNWSQADLLETVSCLSPEELDRERPNQRWNISGIIRHVGGAEWWYLDRLGLAFPRAEAPQDPFDRLARVRGHLSSVLPTLAGINQVVGVDGEFWSPRKLLRRAVWHVRDHVEHIRKVIGE
jgi:hypothetical protein